MRRLFIFKDDRPVVNDWRQGAAGSPVAKKKTQIICGKTGRPRDRGDGKIVNCGKLLACMKTLK